MNKLHVYLKKKANLTFFIILWNACLQGQGKDGSSAEELHYNGGLSLDTKNPQKALCNGMHLQSQHS